MTVRKFAFQQGMTLIELMVSMAIGMFLILGAVTVYSQGRQNYQTNEHVSRLQENLRFAISVLEPDVRLAGYWGLSNRVAEPATVTAAVAISCDGTDVSDWALDIGLSIEAFNNIPADDVDVVMPDCPSFGAGIVPDTDILILRHASAQPAALRAGNIQLASGVQGMEMFDDGDEPDAFVPLDADQKTIRDLVVNVWYVAADSESMEGVPSLRRITLVGDEMVDEEVIAGVENLQVQFGVDTDGQVDADNRHTIERYVDAEDPILDDVGVGIVAVRLWTLVRATDAEQGFVARGSDADWPGYIPLDDELDPIRPTDNFRRVAASKTIFVRNFIRPDESTALAIAAAAEGS